MEKIYRNRNGTIFVEIPESSDREKLRKVTEEFLKKVLNGGSINEHSNTSRNFREEQILH